MNISLILRALVLLGVGATQAQNSTVPAGKQYPSLEIATLQTNYKAATERFDEECKKAVAALERSYCGALERLQKERTKAGDLDGALAAKAERERISAHNETAEKDIKIISPPLRRLRDTFDASLKKIVEDQTRRTLPAARKYIADLEALQSAITKRGDIEGALMVRSEKERFTTTFAFAPTVDGPPNASGQTPAPGKNDAEVIGQPTPFNCGEGARSNPSISNLPNATPSG